MGRQQHNEIRPHGTAKGRIRKREGSTRKPRVTVARQQVGTCVVHARSGLSGFMHLVIFSLPAKISYLSSEMSLASVCIFLVPG
jgi:hypothetical protein